MNLFSLSIIVTITGIAVVFFVLILLSLIIKIYGQATNKYTQKNFYVDKKAQILEKIKTSHNKKTENEIIAVISAAAYSYYSGKNNKKIVIKKIQRQGEILSPIWRTVGIIENTSNYF